MTTYEKAKAYDEALERAKSFIENGDETERTIAESIFAGIMEESEDEKWRNWLIGHLKGYINQTDNKYAEVCKKAIAWLEKQGEQKPAWSEEDDIRFNHLIGFISKYGLQYYASTDKVIDWLKSLEERVQPKQKQEWSEDDKFHIGRIINYLESFKAYNAPHIEPIKKEIDWLKSIKDRYTWKPSEVQIEALKEAVDEHFDIDGGALWHLYEDLKKLMEE